jgi:diaminohydroxyphosphoribosylaminopyrimidine deaminase/5-amino-6-(5-phosphoribosylamino)uracil reductase
MGERNEAEQWMNRAIELAARGRGLVEPNPMVGAVLVRDGNIIGQGFHQRFGGPHAEVEALNDCADPSGADVYVTLEPCCHHGKTPPCADALIDAKVGRVFIAMVDPSAHAAGKGIDKLRDSGIEVVTGICEGAAKRLIEPFIKRTTTGQPWMIAKWAQTLDGCIATSTGDSKWISNEQSRRYVHELRARVDAIVIGIGTALADDPQLTARDVEVHRVARRVVVDPSLRLPMDSLLMQAPEQLTIAVSADADAARRSRLESVGVDFVTLTDRSLSPLLEYLARKHTATNVLVEGGSSLMGSLIEQGLIDQVLAFIAPKILGDDDAVPAMRGLVCDSIEQARKLQLRDVTQIADDVLLDYRVCVS